MKFAVLTFVLGIAAVCSTAQAQPSGGYYLFKHKQSGEVVCFQGRINAEWDRLSGPYQDSECKIAEKLKPQRSDLPANPLDLAPKK